MCLPDIDNLEIITSDLNVAANASLLPNIAITIIGGRLRGGLELYGPDTIKYIKSCKFVDKYFMSVFGVSIKHGLTTNLPSNTMKKKAMMDIANETILLADSSKFDVNEGHWIADIKDLDKIITAKAVPQYIIKEIKELGIDVLQV
jgi:DeoR/GlpR family transcriptional regulator of sugar metabolism